MTLKLGKSYDHSGREVEIIPNIPFIEVNEISWNVKPFHGICSVCFCPIETDSWIAEYKVGRNLPDTNIMMQTRRHTLCQRK